MNQSIEEINQAQRSGKRVQANCAFKDIGRTRLSWPLNPSNSALRILLSHFTGLISTSRPVFSPEATFRVLSLYAGSSDCEPDQLGQLEYVSEEEQHG